MLIWPLTLSKMRLFVGMQKQSLSPTQTLTNNLSATFRGQMDLFFGQTLYEIQGF